MTMVGLALREARERQGLSQEALGRMVYRSGRLISAYECGTRRMALEDAAQLARQLDDPDLYRALAWEITGGVFAAPPLMGHRVDRHRCAVAAKVLEELDEAEEALRSLRLAKPPEASERSRAEAVAEALVDAVVALEEMVAALSRSYAFSPSSPYRRWMDKARSRGYVVAGR